MKNRHTNKTDRKAIRGLTPAEWLIAAGTTGITIGLLMSFFTVVSVGTARYPAYYVNAGRSSFLQMILGLQHKPVLQYYISLSVIGGVLLGLGFLLKRRNTNNIREKNA